MMRMKASVYETEGRDYGIRQHRNAPLNDRPEPESALSGGRSFRSRSARSVSAGHRIR